MANKSNEIGDIAKKAKILLLDIEGTTTSISFVKDKLFPYAAENVKKFLEAQWETEEVKGAIEELRKLSLEDQENKVEGVVAILAEDTKKEDLIESITNSVKWMMSMDRKAGPLKTLQGLIWKQGYDNGDIKGHVYDDVLPVLEQWKSVEGQKVYIYSSGSVQAQKLLFGQSSSGDLLKHIDGHFDTAVGPKQEEDSYKKIVQEIGCKPEEVLFLTDILKEGTAAVAAGLSVCLLSREGNAPLPDDQPLHVITSLTQLSTSHKRKTDTQDEVPAKILKTDSEGNLKTTSEENTSAKKDDTVEEKMEVEESKEKTEETKDEVRVETTIEEISESATVEDAPVVTKEPIVEDGDVEMTEEKVEKPVSSDTKPTEKENDKDSIQTEPVAEETPPTVITEIEEITPDKPVLDGAADVIEDLEPIVEEPTSVENDITELQNVGEVLEKECDEILSKVQDVTNLDNIAVKPLLNSISEDTIENENLDSNDIVDRILDSEIEQEVKNGDKADTMKEENVEAPQKNENVEEKTDAEKTPTETIKNGTTENVTEQNNSEPKEETKESPVSKSEDKEATEEPKTEDKTDTQSEAKIEETAKVVKPEETVTEVKTNDGETKEPHLNGNGTANGKMEALNGDDIKELADRLNGDEEKKVNGANGNSNGVEETEKEEVPEIKVKSVNADALPDNIPQATEA